MEKIKDWYLIHVWTPVFQGTEPECLKARENYLKENPSENPRLKVISIEEWEKLWNTDTNVEGN